MCLIDFVIYRSSDVHRHVVDYEAGEGVTTRIVEEGDNVVEL